MGKRKKEPGFYWLYYKPTKEWTIAEFDGEAWSFIGSDETTKNLSDDYHIGIDIVTPTYHITS